MSIEISEKIALIRESERLSRAEFCELTGISYQSLYSYEKGTKGISFNQAEKILCHPKFKKYTLWFMTGDVAPESGQIEPALAHVGRDKTTCSASGQKTG